MLLLTASAYAVVSRRGWTRSLYGAATVATVAGVWTGFATNMRTSHFPIYLSLIILLFASGEFAFLKDRQPSRLRRMAMAAAMFVAGFFAFQYVAITRHLPRDLDATARHTIFHSVVIGLGVPESDLSRREGLTWSDRAAYAAALRTDPKTGYLTRSYETALFNYYSGLWSQYPGDMMHVYWAKAQHRRQAHARVPPHATRQDRAGSSRSLSRPWISCPTGSGWRSCTLQLRQAACGGSGAIRVRLGLCSPSRPSRRSCCNSRPP